MRTRTGGRASARLLLAAAMLLLSGACTGTSSLSGPESSSAGGAQRQVEGAKEGEARRLTYWAELNGNAGSIVPTFQQVPFFQEWQRQTGVELTFIQPPANQARESLNVLLASGDLPDMIEFEWDTFPGGPDKAIADGYILRLNEVIEKHAPNLRKYLSEHPEIDKQVKTGSGSYYVFPFIRGDDRLLTFQGPIVRKDWLDELGLPIPETIGQWHETLKAFKERKGAAAPLTFLGVPHPLFGLEGGAFIGAFGVKNGFYLEEGRVKFGPLEPGYKEFLSLFRQWYDEGLIDRNIATVDTKTMDANVISGRSGASIWNAGAGIGTWQPFMQAKDPKARLAAAPYPVLNKGERPKFGQRSFDYVGTGGVAISANSPNVEEAVRMLDYGYGEEGHLLFNFGIEGQSYEMIDGYPTYTKLILDNPDKLAPSQALAMYTRASYFGAFVQDGRYIEQYYLLPEQRQAMDIWSDTDAAKHRMPRVSLSEKENAELSAIMQDVETLVDEVSLKIILGVEPLSSFDDCVAELRTLGIGRAIEIQEKALAVALKG
ncbi:ABC transporter substrate-binding protein [Cohnella sp. CIP 111063]|jgi:putative aldouronate transport system substrate-binding protein|uniref:extracellular solute-binding protein n=1 Tax=unclassified Cohnella TaxID=2636738 RepID=UPI000B9CC2EA|nr:MULTISPECIES: extracellular solute-binding protein [unclassified Cohnella]OXS60246.1 ABC transporter substrate-binding protein [Cohnella sp. CIP 111063]PRX72925.1 putative aldouronate transport system substrate-binding protein [Cohnella sp. SGD-V74]